MCIHNSKNDKTHINGYPVKLSYKYLGITMDQNLSPHQGLMQINSKLEVYNKRNSWLIKKYFTPKSLVCISQYYQFSRLGYGMSCYLDNKDIIDRVEKHSIRYTKSIFGLSYQVNSDRLRLILARPREKHMLWVLLRKTLRKYKKHFGDDPFIYNRVNADYLSWYRTGIGILKQVDPDLLTYENFKQIVANKSRESLADDLKIPIINNFSDMFRKHYYKYPDKRDGHLIRYLDNFGFYTTRFDGCGICKHCGEGNSRTHVTNECSGFKDLRESTTKKLEKLTGKRVGTNLEGAIINGYFNTEYPYSSNMPEILEVIKSFATNLLIENSDYEREMKKMNLIE
jgi:hypothetical protein